MEVTNISGDELILGALSSYRWLLPGGLRAAIGPAELDLITGESEWCGRTAGSATRYAATCRRCPSAAHQLSSKSAHSARVLGSWSTGGALPAGVLATRDDSFALAWQVEHNGAWRWDLADQPAGLTLTLSGPTDADHQWQYQPGRPSERFRPP